MNQAELDAIRALAKKTVDASKPRAPAPQQATAQAAQGGQTPPAQQGKPFIPYMLGGVAIPRKLETRHNLFVGTTGAGKTRLFIQFLSAVRARNEPAIIPDPGGEMLRRFYRPGVDLIWSPDDSRSTGWTAFNDLHSVLEYKLMAQNFVRPPADGKDGDWFLKAANLVAHTLSALDDMGNTDEEFRTNESLFHALLMAPAHGEKGSLQGLLTDTPSRIYFASGAEKALDSIRGIVGDVMEPLRWVEDGPLSIHDFVRSIDQRGEDEVAPWLFLPYTDASFSTFSNFYTALVSMAIQAGLLLSENGERRWHLVLDEMPALGKIADIDKALTRLRKYGCVVTGGVQSTAQFKKHYGDAGSVELMSCFGNWAMLRVSDPDTAEFLSKFVGQYEYWEASKTKSSSTSVGQDVSTTKSESEALSLKQKPLIMAREFQELPDLAAQVVIGGYQIPDAQGRACRVVRTVVPTDEPIPRDQWNPAFSPVERFKIKRKKAQPKAASFFIDEEPDAAK